MRRVAMLAAAVAAAATVSACAGVAAEPSPGSSIPAATTSAVVASGGADSASPQVSVRADAGANVGTGTGTGTGTAAQPTSFYDAPNQADVAYQQAKDQGREADAALLERIASQPAATWLGEWSGDVAATVRTITHDAAAADQIALLVVYDIPGRDCGLYSAGGAAQGEYLDWVGQVASGIADDATVWVILEPDALAQMGDCDGQGDRAALLAGAARTLDDAGAEVFLDAGHAGWNSAADTAARIEQVGTQHLAGFATNTSNYDDTSAEQAWADQVASAVGLPYVVDTSRNGNGSTGEWCNPRGRALGQNPGLTGRATGMIATVWAKVPGESDGTCNGGPAAGQWWDEMALELARDAS
ncbi:glycoside hydrolase family 6 protein [Demequina capsici]|uniref:Glucanase n=1 Tax=Demequina capsici TaxID=3075620 RepID=A0AA96F6Z7_9MICO|nr:glycoside hydrolase family 6 protein [Demequina sp. OYTSA14]WNM24759.1 glycoside hydrolase family 6 protein [Demequina sp. OYTSA14]